MKAVGIDRIALLASADLAAAEVALRKIPNDDPAGAFTPTVLAEIAAGRYFLRAVSFNGSPEGLTVFAVEKFGDHKEFVSVATYVPPKVKPCRLLLADALENYARAQGCQSIRMHTCRHGLVSEALAQGWHTAEIVLRKSL